MRPIPVALALILAAGLLPASVRADSDERAPYMERSDRSVEATGIRALDVENSRGQVRLTASPDGRLHVVATKICRVDNRDEARRLSDATTVEAGLSDGKYVVRVHYPRRIDARVNVWDLFTEHGRHGLHLPVVEVRLELEAPAALPATITTTSGDAFVQGMAGGLGLTSASGDLEVADARGPLEASSTSGDVQLSGIASARVHTSSGDVTVEGAALLDVTTTSGDVNVSGARQALALETSSGDIVVVDAPAGVRAHSASGELVLRSACGRVDAETQSGGIRARLRGPLTGARLTSASGEIALTLVPGLPATIAARSVSGSIDCQVPATVTAHDRNSLDARIGQGGAPVRLESTSGNVSIMSGGK